MKKFLYKILLVNDLHLKRFAKLYAWIYIVMGFLSIIGVIVLYFLLAPKVEFINQTLNEAGSIIITNTNENAMNYNGINAASKMLKACAEFMSSVFVPFTLLLCLLGVIVALIGILYYRIHEFINKDT